MRDLKRTPDWQRRLNEHLVASQRVYHETGLEWGRFDCCTFAADWVKAATGHDPMADYRGRYASQDEAQALLRGNGETLLQALTRLFGEPVHPAMARRGDLAWRREENALGVVYTAGARQLACFLGENGFASLAMSDCDAAFVVGNRQ